MNMPILVVGKTEIPYRVRESERARKKRIIVTPSGVEVVVPEGTAHDTVAAFVHAKRRWVFDKVDEVYDAVRARGRLTGQTWVGGAKVLYRGRHLALTVKLADVDAPVVVYRSRFDVRLPEATKPEGRQQATKAAVQGWLRDRARIEAKALVGRYARRVGVSPRRVEVRAMARLWGSCGRDGVIRMDEEFLRLPAHLAEYLAAHEVAHLVHRDHSAAFWRLLRSVLPDARARHAELLATGRGV